MEKKKEVITILLLVGAYIFLNTSLPGIIDSFNPESKIAILSWSGRIIPVDMKYGYGLIDSVTIQNNSDKTVSNVRFAFKGIASTFTSLEIYSNKMGIKIPPHRKTTLTNIRCDRPEYPDLSNNGYIANDYTQVHIRIKDAEYSN